jgi:hypothetical protein
MAGGSIKLSNKKFTSITNDYCLHFDLESDIRELPDEPLIPQAYTAFNFTSLEKIKEIPP